MIYIRAGSDCIHSHNKSLFQLKQSFTVEATILATK